MGECRQGIAAKAMVLATKIDVQDICGADQLCAGTKVHVHVHVGIEAAVHAMRDVFETNET